MKKKSPEDDHTTVAPLCVLLESPAEHSLPDNLPVIKWVVAPMTRLDILILGVLNFN